MMNEGFEETEKNINGLTENANNGNVDAMVKLATMYFKGEGVNQDYGKAKGLLETAVANGSKKANYCLGVMYYNGLGVATDYNKAKEYFENSAANENIFSKFYLGKIYYWGDGVEKNEEKANEFKTEILSKPLYVNQTANLSDFYSIVDFEECTQNFVGELQERVNLEYKSLYGKELL